MLSKAALQHLAEMQSGSHALCIAIPRFRHSLVRHRCPNRLGGFLLFKPALKDVSELLHVEHAHRGAGDAVNGEQKTP